VLAVLMSGGAFYFTSQYLKFKDDQILLASLKRQEKIQKTQIDKFSKQVRSFETEMARLESFEKKLRIITAFENSPKSGQESLGVGGPYGLSSHSFSTSLEKETQSMLDRLSGDLNILTNQIKMRQFSFQELDEYLKNQQSLLASTPSIWPTRGWVTSGFGYRKSPFTGIPEKHEGLDIAARMGSEIRATADGMVVLSGRENGYGNMVEVDHGYGVMTRYGHNSKNLVNVGDKIKRGQVIALVGNTGRSTGPHVHYEVLVNGIPVSPRNYILED
nr:peptidoglycan DD-metalloendopeptidase family protein [Nitrospinaceae bacterium]NIR57256.1 peptidoglycan DD-metalloendopeptidase family protein [Nitrospinaceae bacterium]NIS87704.1 peptidoglycan DD-metalloendopeptidase family protein [Nitrospinaceae bacterium]NIT84570.1 peptidoglycan DD-metalloendopeptidase family protein [Nitrospinaceae bacterium]NIU46756.1 peptidoglycan DD-metalloendopeptidase family protein [Nitrospinaceae bacterium]